ncbi:hypothetical protein [Clostridium butyricum]|uniref:hypothetical protein n=1 Tax=Clostridium butyricum TaxID=1492 RepID=UPI0022E3F684|nr:hypothetical protein [Clostridium butyricum]
MALISLNNLSPREFWTLASISAFIVFQIFWKIYCFIENNKDSNFKSIQDELYLRVSSKVYCICIGILVAAITI